MLVRQLFSLTPGQRHTHTLLSSVALEYCLEYCQTGPFAHEWCVGPEHS